MAQRVWRWFIAPIGADRGVLLAFMGLVLVLLGARSHGWRVAYCMSTAIAFLAVAATNALPTRWAWLGARVNRVTAPVLRLAAVATLVLLLLADLP